MKVLVAGATGGTGKWIVQELVDRQIPVKALVRDLDLSQNLFPPEVELVLGDVLKPDTLKNAIADFLD